MQHCPFCNKKCVNFTIKLDAEISIWMQSGYEGYDLSATLLVAPLHTFLKSPYFTKHRYCLNKKQKRNESVTTFHLGQLVDWCICGPTCRALKWGVIPHWFFFQQRNIGASICIGREIQCLPYAGCFFYTFFTTKKSLLNPATWHLTCDTWHLKCNTWHTRGAKGRFQKKKV